MNITRMEQLITTEECYETPGLLQNHGRASISGMYGPWYMELLMPALEFYS